MEKNQKTKSTPLVTVVTATFNSNQTLKLTLQSLLDQDFTDFEAWVVGDCCTDSSQQVVESFNDRRLNWVNLTKNSGNQAIPNNAGIKRAQGKYIAYLGHDDLWFPWHLSTLVEFIQQNEADLVHSMSAVFSPEGFNFTVGPPCLGRTYANHFVFPSCWLHKKDIVKDCGFWEDPPKPSRGVDLEYSRKIHLMGKKISFAPRLSLLKFPSMYWGTYSAEFQLGQADYYEKLKTDPKKLEQEILNQSAIELARRIYPRMSILQAIKKLITSIIYRLVDLIGPDNWPISAMRRLYFKRWRKGVQKKRGLIP